MANRGRPVTLKNTNSKVEMLRAVEAGSQDFTHYMKKNLVSTGYVAEETVKSGGRGRPAKVLVLTKKGANYLRLSKNFYKAGKNEAKETFADAYDYDASVCNAENEGMVMAA